MSGSSEPFPEGPAPPYDTGERGEPVCWLERVCEDCGALADGPPEAVCARCGSERPAGPAE
jgi:hypothetical protein